MSSDRFDATNARSAYRAAPGARTANAFSDGGGHLWVAAHEFGAPQFDVRWLARCWPRAALALMVRPLRSWLVSKCDIMKLLPREIQGADRNRSEALAICAAGGGGGAALRARGGGGGDDDDAARYANAVGKVVAWTIFREFYHRRALDFLRGLTARDDGGGGGGDDGGDGRSDGAARRWVVADLVSDIDLARRALRRLVDRSALAEVVAAAPPRAPAPAVEEGAAGAVAAAAPRDHHHRPAPAASHATSADVSTDELEACYRRIVDDALVAINLADEPARSAQVLAFPEHQGLLRAWWWT